MVFLFCCTLFICLSIFYFNLCYFSLSMPTLHSYFLLLFAHRFLLLLPNWISPTRDQQRHLSLILSLSFTLCNVEISVKYPLKVYRAHSDVFKLAVVLDKLSTTQRYLINKYIKWELQSLIQVKQQINSNYFATWFIVIFTFADTSSPNLSIWNLSFLYLIVKQRFGLVVKKKKKQAIEID